MYMTYINNTTIFTEGFNKWLRRERNQELFSLRNTQMIWPLSKPEDLRGLGGMAEGSDMMRKRRSDQLKQASSSDFPVSTQIYEFAVQK